MLCSVIIATWKRPIALRETLESLADQSEHRFEVVVVCDGPDLATRSFSKEIHLPYPLRWIFHERNLGLASARNTGAENACGELLLALDDDTPVHPHLVANHAKHHATAAHDTRLAVYGKIIENRRSPLRCYTDKFLQSSWERTLEQTQARIASDGPMSVGQEIERSMCFGLNCSIRREVFLKSGGFNSRLRWMAQDMEFGHRLYQSGVRFVFEPEAIVMHRNTKNMTDYFRRCWFLGGGVDVQRVFEFGQRNPQTEQLVSTHRGYLTNKLVARLFWHGTPVLKGVSDILERATNLSGSRQLFGIWARTCQATEYWRAVKAEGCRLHDLETVAGKGTSVLMFHSISVPQFREEASYCVTPDRFCRLMKLATSASYRFCSTEEYLSSSAGERRVLLTFDDGYEDLFTELMPIVDRFHLRGVVFLVYERLGDTNVWARGLGKRKLLNVAQVREMQKYGFEFGSHTLTHPSLPTLADKDLQAEITDSKHRLEDLLGTEVNCFAYPFGDLDQRVRSAVATAGYKLAFTARPGLNGWNDPLSLNRTDISDKDSVFSFALKMRYGYSARQWLGARWRSIEDEVPSKTLRKTARHLGDSVRSLLASLDS